MTKVGKNKWVFNGNNNRRLSVKEIARIQTFPDWFEFCGSDSDAYRQIGNAVAVPMGRWVGSQIVKYFNG